MIFRRWNKGDDFSKIRVSPGAYEIEMLNIEFRRNVIEGGYPTEVNYPFTRKPGFSTLTAIIEISSNIAGSQIAVTPDDSLRDLFGFKPVLIH